MNEPVQSLFGFDLPDGLSLRSADELVGGAHELTLPTAVYGWRDTAEHRTLLARLSDGAVIGVARAPEKTSLEWTADSGALSPELAGLTLTIDTHHIGGSTFSPGPAKDLPGTLARLDGRPWFVRVMSGRQCLYLLGIDTVPDGQLTVTSADQELSLVSASIALLLFMRTHAPDRVWRSSLPSANLIIDDPLLRPRYGCVRDSDLAASVTASNSALTIAFIPWNARRSAPMTVRLFKQTRGLSICAHGWEHIHDEFAIDDAADAEWRASAAMRGMRLHQRLTGLDFEEVMVFPQGRFATTAMTAIAHEGFLAAVNSTFLAADRQDVVRLRHLLEPAVTAYGPAPLFRRRGPRYIDRFRYDVLLGKPLLLVEHHAYFHDRGAAFRDVVRKMRTISPQIRWRGLGNIVRETHLARPLPCGATEVRMYTRQFRMSPVAAGTYVFSKVERAGDVAAVRVDGRIVDFAHQGPLLTVPVTVSHDAAAIEIAIEPTGATIASRQRSTRTNSFAVSMRRYASERRDQLTAAAAQTRSLLRRLNPSSRRTSEH